MSQAWEGCATMRCYLAHPPCELSAPRRVSAIRAIEAKGWAVVNPDYLLHQISYGVCGMGRFEAMVTDCDALVFMRMPLSGRVGAGVDKDIEVAWSRELPIFEFRCGRLVKIRKTPGPVLSIDETLAELARVREIAVAKASRAAAAEARAVTVDVRAVMTNALQEIIDEISCQVPDDPDVEEVHRAVERIRFRYARRVA